MIFYFKQRLLAFSLLIFAISSCRTNVEEITEPISKKEIANHFFEIQDIVENRGFIPLDLMQDHFKLEEIDFSKHWVLNELGLQGFEFQRSNHKILATFKSQLSRLNGLILILIPNETGFRAIIEDKTGVEYDYIWSLNKDLERLHITDNEGIKKTYRSSHPDIEDENIIMNAFFKSSVIITYVIREFYFRSLVKDFDSIYPDDFKITTGSERVNLQPTCSHFPEHYYSCIGLTFSSCVQEIEWNLQPACSNRFCIGCCGGIIYDHYCQLGGLYCFVQGSGRVCLDDGRDTDGGYFDDNNCDANTPCPCGSYC